MFYKKSSDNNALLFIQDRLDTLSAIALIMANSGRYHPLCAIIFETLFFMIPIPEKVDICLPVRQ